MVSSLKVIEVGCLGTRTARAEVVTAGNQSVTDTANRATDVLDRRAHFHEQPANPANATCSRWW